MHSGKVIYGAHRLYLCAAEKAKDRWYNYWLCFCEDNVSLFHSSNVRVWQHLLMFVQFCVFIIKYNILLVTNLRLDDAN
jgi:hypothetical protein